MHNYRIWIDMWKQVIKNCIIFYLAYNILFSYIFVLIFFCLILAHSEFFFRYVSLKEAYKLSDWLRSHVSTFVDKQEIRTWAFIYMLLNLKMYTLIKCIMFGYFIISSYIFYKTVNLEKTFTLSYATSAQCHRRAAGLIEARRRHLFSTCQEPSTWMCDNIGFRLCASGTILADSILHHWVQKMI